MAGRGHPTSEVRGSGREELPGVRGQGCGREEPPTPEARASGWEEQPEEWWLCRRRRAWRSYPTLNVRNGGGKEIPLVQGKGQRLCFAGAAVRRYPTPR